MPEGKQKYIFLPEQVCFDKRLSPSARLLYGVIAVLTAKDGYCWARNSFFADKFHVRPETVSKAISALEEAGYIRLEFEGQGKENRRIYTLDENVIPYDENVIGTLDEKVIPYDKKVKDPCEKSQGTLDENVKQINTRDNNIYNYCAEPETDSTPPVMLLPLNDGTEYPVTEEQCHEWAGLYPAVDVIQQLRNMRGWLDTNPTRRKTRRGIKRFINGWLGKEQNRAKPGQETPKKATKKIINGVEVNWYD